MSLLNESNHLPDGLIGTDFGPVSEQCLKKGLTSFSQAVRYVGGLPYGRTANRADYMLVLSEEKGTCSGKHALLAALAHEIGLDIELVLGIFEMTEVNTPLTGPVLRSSGMTSVPEAHCYLRFKDTRFDVTFGSDAHSPKLKFLTEQVIRPCDIGDTKIKFHREFLTTWLNSDDKEEIERVWQVRERCIRALSPVEN